MPRRCSTRKMIGGKGYSLHVFPKIERIWQLCKSAVKLHRKDFDDPSDSSLLCSRHFTDDCFEIEGQRYRNEYGIPAQKRLVKKDAVPAIFPKSNQQTPMIVEAALQHKAVLCLYEESKDR